MICVLSVNTFCSQHNNGAKGNQMENSQSAVDSGKPQYTNALIHEKSPYLLQHAHNPVNWYPWGEEALQRAKKENKPIFLSIGYATCHWCHVMEKESFEDEEVAEILNRSFIAIKVDREERPDIDAIYMDVCQAVTGSGGWPLTVFLTPDLQPFFVGTYFPKVARYGRPGFIDIIKQIEQLWETDRERIIQSAAEITQALQQRSAPVGDLSLDVLDSAIALYKKHYDPQNGGFGTAPKFPSPQNVLLLLQLYYKTQDPSLLSMVHTTLTKMRLGGIYDHIGFGFHRYSTDAQWIVPHFEKMLYDQAMLVIAYTRAYQLTKNPLFRQTAEETIDYVLREMTHPAGGFYSAEDADSEGEEGKFYLWSVEELRTVLTEEEFRIVEKVFNTSHAQGALSGKHVLYRTDTDSAVAAFFHISVEEFQEQLEQIRQKLFRSREQRIHPLKDDKILTDWNGLMIAACAIAYQAYQNPKYLSAAEKAWEFLHRSVVKEKTLYHRWREEAAIEGFLDDYIFLAYGAWELYKATLRPHYLQRCRDLLRQAIALFADSADGGFYQTHIHHNQPLYRHKEAYDGAYPSGNGMAATILAYSGHLTSNNEFLRYAERTISAFGKLIQQYPIGFAQSLIAYDFLLSPKQEIIIAAPSHLLQNSFIKLCQENYLPYAVYAVNDGSELIRQLIPYSTYQPPLNNRPTAYICQNYSCQAPITDDAEFRKQLNRMLRINATGN